VAVSRASFQGRRRETGVSIVPRYTRSVRIVMAASATQGSKPGASGASAGSMQMQSGMKTPSQPAASASEARSGRVRTSPLGMMNPYRMRTSCVGGRSRRLIARSPAD